MIDGHRVIDFHGHIGRWDRYGMIDDPALMLHAMAAAGIDIACLFAIFHPDGTTGNDLLARFISNHPDRFVGFAYVSPTVPERMVAELARAIDTLQFVAIKLYPPYTPWPFNAEQWHPVYRFANERGLTVIFHTDPVKKAVRGILKRLRRFIRTPILLPVTPAMIRMREKKPLLRRLSIPMSIWKPVLPSGYQVSLSNW